MNRLKRMLGLLWIALGLAAGWYLVVHQALPRFSKAGSEELIPALIYAFILTPIITGGLILFGRYAWMGEYDEESSK